MPKIQVREKIAKVMKALKNIALRLARVPMKDPRFRSPAFYLAMFGSIKLVCANFNMPWIPDEQWEAYANILAAGFTIVGIALSWPNATTPSDYVEPPGIEDENTP